MDHGKWDGVSTYHLGKDVHKVDEDVWPFDRVKATHRAHALAGARRDGTMGSAKAMEWGHDGLNEGHGMAAGMGWV